MTEILSVSLPVIMAATFVASGVAKLLHPDDLRGWRELGVPRWLRRRWLLRSHPWGEIALGGALALLGGALGVAAALVAVALMAAYTVLVVRVLRRTPDASCACFGEPAPVTRWTVVRNVWLTAVAIATTAVVWAVPLWGGALRAATGAAGWTVASLAVAAITVFLVMRREGGAVSASTQAESPALGAAGADEDDDLDYIRTRTPAVPVTLADGTVVSLRALAAPRPILLLAVRETCSPCGTVIENLETYRALLPEVDVRLLLAAEPGDSALTSTAEPQTLHDPRQYVLDSLMDAPGTPAAVLLAPDGQLAGGPVLGSDAVEVFIDDIYESLHGERPRRTAA